MIVALVHSRGFVLNKTFYCLELAYSDIAGRRETFLVRSPLSFFEIKALHPRMPLTVQVSTVAGNAVVPYRRVLKFLRERHEILSRASPTRVARFAYKGRSYQADVLLNAGISNVVNVEDKPWSVPSIATLKVLYRNENRRICHNHRDPAHDCADWIVTCVLNYMNSHKGEEEFLFKL